MAKSRSILNPVERTSEVLFGLIMALTFTGSISAANAAREDVRTMLFGAIGCNIAWGLVDALMYLITSYISRAREQTTSWLIRGSINAAEGSNAIIREALPTAIAEVITEAELESLRSRMSNRPPALSLSNFRWDDLKGAFGIFLLVCLSTFPVALPFVFMRNPYWALRTSNLVALGMLFLSGFALGKYANQKPWFLGFAMMILGTALVGITMALGG